MWRIALLSLTTTMITWDPLVSVFLCRVIVVTAVVVIVVVAAAAVVVVATAVVVVVMVLGRRGKAEGEQGGVVRAFREWGQGEVVGMLLLWEQEDL